MGDIPGEGEHSLGREGEVEGMKNSEGGNRRGGTTKAIKKRKKIRKLKPRELLKRRFRNSNRDYEGKLHQQSARDKREKLRH